MTEISDIPRDLIAERSVLGAMMLSGAAVTEARKVVIASDFHAPQHELLFALLCDLADAGTRIDAVVVRNEACRRDQLRKVGGEGYLHTLIAEVPTTANAGYYAMAVRTAARRRQLVQAGQRIAQIGTDVADLDEALSAAARESLTLSMIVDETIDGPVQGLSTFAEFLDEADLPADWIVPGLLERQDVVMILAKPGLGKSWLSRQIALAVACGVHPFHPERRIAPATTLLVDLENPPSMARRQTRSIASAVARLGSWDPQRAHIWSQPGGINLRRYADAASFERVIAATQPALVCLGSLYNAFERGRDDWDTAAEETKAVFNRMRGRYRCAFWIEHHMPRASRANEAKNPFGSSVWERWPRFGRVIDRRSDSAFALERSFRGDADVREFPVGLVRGGPLPWTAIWDEAELTHLSGRTP